MKRVVSTVLTVAFLVAACTGSGSDGPTTTHDSTVTSTVTRTRTATPTFTPKPDTTVAPLPPGAAPARGEVEQPCPYIASSQDQGSVSIADLEGDRVYRTTVLTGFRPVGCRFYFWAGPFQAIADIRPQTFPTAQAAHDALILTGQQGVDQQGYPDLLPGVDAISYRTVFVDGNTRDDWACAFAKGKVLVVVRTQRADQSFNARAIAEAIAAKF